MKKAELLNRISGSFSKIGFTLKKHSPEILIVAGVVGTVVSAVMACKATTKVSAIISNTKENLDAIHDCSGDNSLAENYSQEDAKKDLVIVYAQTGLKLAKLYAPSILLGVLSISGILASNDILRKRNVALVAAYATIDTGFKEYRNRVIDRFGEKIDHELKYNVQEKKFDEIEVDSKTGKEKNVEKTIDISDPNTYSDYARFFDEGCANWEKDSEYNLMFLRREQNYANDRLKSKGFLFLNDVYARLGIPETKAGQVVGWIYKPENPNGDNYIEFGIYETNREVVRNFVNGYERSILLDFNVDGPILDLM